MRLFQNAHYDFLGSRRRAYIVSAVVLVIGLGSILLHGGLRFGVDFTGGTLFQIGLDQPASVADVRSALAGSGLGDAQIQRFGSPTEFLIRVAQYDEGADETLVDEVNRSLNEAYGDGWRLERAEALTARVGKELQRGALIAILVSFALTLLYLAFRFEWRFGVAAVIATLHDILITFGFISVLNIEITLTTVAAILTVVGYSLNDTIVVFDRIRENEARYATQKPPYADIINVSMNQVLMRSLMTSFSSIVPVTSLLLIGSGVLGAATLSEFALALLIGMVTGAYSSIFVAAPLLGLLKSRDPNWQSRKIHRAVGDALREMVMGGTVGSRRTRAVAAGADEVATSESSATETPTTASTGAAKAALAHPPRPRKKKRR
jgi:preprotein translocase subunit SecF